MAAPNKRRIVPRKDAISKIYGKGRNLAAKVVQDYEIFEMAREGYNPVEIAKALEKRGVKLTPTTIRKRIDNVLTNVHENSLQNVEEVRQMELAKLDRLDTKLNAMLAQRNVKSAMKVQIIDRLRNLMELRHKLLGLQQQKVENKTDITVRIYKGLDEGDVPETPQIQTHYPMLPTPEVADSRSGPVLIGQKSA